MDTLKHLLIDVADQARPYAVVERAIATTRRRQRLTVLAPVAAGVAILVLVGGGWLWAGRRPAPAVLALPGVSAVCDWLPAGLAVPAKHPDPLPTAAGIGVAALVYQPASLDGQTGDGAGTIVVTPRGAQYWLAPTRQGVPQQVLGLSPDGRWLLLARGTALVLRDLSSAREWPLTGTGYSPVGGRFDHMYWSPDGHWLALYHAGRSEGERDTATVVAVPPGPQWTLPRLIGTNLVPAGVLADGALVLGPISTGVYSDPPATGPYTQFTVSTLDAGSTEVQHTEMLDLADFLGQPTRPTDDYELETQLVGDRRYAVRAYPFGKEDGVMAPTVPFLVDLAAGTVTALPVPGDPADLRLLPVRRVDPLTQTNGQWRDLIGTRDATHLLLAHYGPSRPGAGGASTVRLIEVWDITTGAVAGATPIAGAARWVLVRGGFRAATGG